MLKVLECKHCHAGLPEDELARGEDIVVCSFCDTVHHMNQQAVGFPEKPKRREKAKRDKPDKFTLNKLADGVEINYRWLGKQHTGLLFFAVIWNAFILFFTFMMIFGGFESDDDPGIMVLCFMIPFYAVGIGMAWYVLTGFMNQTHIQVRRQGISTTHGPIPWFGRDDHNCNRDDIAQVYSRRRVAYTSNDVPVHVYDVHYVKHGGDDYELVKGLDALNKAIYIEQTIEKLYNIADAPVDGEHQSRF
ncbi:MAG: DUF2975 domain-containing protein [Chloroflexota bacterium]